MSGAQGLVAQLIGVSKRFGDAAALHDVSLDVAPGRILGIIGRSGAGKSTLIRLLNGLDRPSSGRVLFEGREISGLDERALQPVRRRIGMIFQHFNLLSAKTAAANVALPLRIAGRPRAERRRRALELLDLVGLSGKAGAYPAQLSGGQKQRVGIARALAADPALLLSDEATSALDPETTEQILDLLRGINRRLGLTVVLITHEMAVVRDVADEVAVMEAGRLVEQGPLLRVLTQPRSAVTGRLLAGLLPVLPAPLAAALRPEGAAGWDALLRLTLLGPAAEAPVLGRLAEAAGAGAVLVHGGIGRVRGVAVGTLFVRVGGGAEAAGRAQASLAGLGEAALLGYLPPGLSPESGAG